MLDHVANRLRDHQLRLIACACCRRIWHLLDDRPDAQKMIETSERYLTGRASLEEQMRAQEPGRFEAASYLFSWPGWLDRIDRLEMELKLLVAASGQVIPYDESGYGPLEPTEAARVAIYQVIQALAAWMHELADKSTVELNENVLARGYREAISQEKLAQCEIIQDVTGNPFRASALNPSWLLWNSGTIIGIVESIVHQGSFVEMPVLADALEDAGCDDRGILDHCTKPRDHVVGCWVLELLKGYPQPATAPGVSP
jgi:hypothetical protein